MFLIDPHTVIAGAFVFLRIGGILFALPILGENPIPVQVRTLMALALTVCIYPVVPDSWFPDHQWDVLVIAGTVVKEISIGLFIGFIAKAMFDGMIMAASIVGYQMGFGTASLLMPGVDFQMDGFTAFHRLLIFMTFLALNLHYMFLSALQQSFAIIPSTAAQLNPSMATLFIAVTANIFVVALKLSAPILIALLFTMAALGLIARTVPQMNVFTLSFPISFFAGLIIYVASFPLFPGWMKNDFAVQGENIFRTLQLMAP